MTTMKRAVIVAALALCAAGVRAQTTLLTDTMSGTAGTDLASHTANSGNTYTALTAGCGTGLYLSGAGTVYPGGTPSGPEYYKASGTFPQNVTLTYSATFNIASNQDYAGIGVVDASGRGYYLTSLNSAYATGAGFSLMSFAYSACNPNYTTMANYTGTLSGSYNATLTVATNGTTVSLSVTITQNGATVWTSGTLTSTLYPAVNQVVVSGYTYQSAATPTTGHQVGSLSATYPNNMSVTPAWVAQGSSGNVLTLTGVGTNWTGGTTFAATAGTITAATVTSATSATLTYTAAATGSSATFSDSSDTATASVAIGNFAAVNSAGFYFSPGNWYVNGAASATTPSAGAYFYFGFTGTGAVLQLNTAALGSNAAVVRVVVDGGPATDTNIQGLSTLTVASGLANTAHTVEVIYRGRTAAADSWNTPTDGLVVTGMVLSGGATVNAPTHLAKTCLILGDSRVEGFNDLSSANGLATSQDATLSAAFAVGQALQCEFALAAYAGIGWTVGGQTNVPAVPSSWNLIYSGRPRTVSGYNDIVEMDLGINDERQGVATSAVTAAVTLWLSAVRAANATAKIVLVPSYDGLYQSAVTAGFNAYETATPDTNALVVTAGLTSAQQAAVWCAGASSYLTTDCIHPTAYGQETVAAGLIANLQAALGGANATVLLGVF